MKAVRSSGRFWPTLSLVSALSLGWAGAQDTDPNALSLQYVGQVPLADLMGGAVGRGVLIYRRAGLPQDQANLVVRLSKADDRAPARAEVYDAGGLNTKALPLRGLNGQGTLPTLPAGLRPVVTLTAPDGWWVRAGTPTYNLDARVLGGIEANWGARLAAEPPDPYITQIRVRDPRGEGRPLWDLRQRQFTVPKPRPSSLQGRLNVNYAERTCDSPVRRTLGLTPAWPYLRLGDGGYEQPIGELRPPIVFDPKRGRVVTFSELVTVRNQNCSYAFYSIAPLKSGVLNHPDFEVPFAFYDLSGKGQGRPNLLLRTERYPAGDPYSVGLDSDVQRGQPLPEHFSTIRYSWRGAVGDQFWDYKVELMGSAPFTARTKIASGAYTIDAPAYSDYPKWAVAQTWPVVTFVAREGEGYASSEGIYEWSPRKVGLGYYLGWNSQPNADAFDKLPEGFRGEYRYGRAAKVELYFSDIDRRLHLMGAAGGVWPLGPDLNLRAQNTDGDAYLDRWTLLRGHSSPEPVPTPDPADPSAAAAPAPTFQATVAGPTPLAELLWSPQAMLLAESGQLTLLSGRVALSRFQIQPPSDPASWRALNAALPLAAQVDRDPGQPGGWLTALNRETPGSARSVWQGVQASQLARVGSGLRFTLDVRAGAQASGAPLPTALRDLSPGRYTVNFDPADGWRTAPAQPAALRGQLYTTGLLLNQPGVLTLRLSNPSNSDWVGRARLLAGQDELRRWTELRVPAGQTVSQTLNWIPRASGTTRVRLETGGAHRTLATVQVGQAPRVNAVQAAHLSAPGPSLAPLYAVLTALLAGLISVWLAWRQP